MGPRVIQDALLDPVQVGSSEDSQGVSKNDQVLLRGRLRVPETLTLEDRNHSQGESDRDGE